MRRLDVVARKHHAVLIALVEFLFASVGIVMIAQGLWRGGWTGIATGAMMVGFSVFLVMVMSQANDKRVKYFAGRGIGLRDGSEIPWSHLVRIVDKIADRNGRQILLRTELEFKDERVGLVLPDEISNFDEVYTFVKGLDCPQFSEPAVMPDYN